MTSVVLAKPNVHITLEAIYVRELANYESLNIWLIQGEHSSL